MSTSAYSMFKTQKARGLQTLSTLDYIWPTWVQIEKQFHVMPWNMPDYYNIGGMFARPCPVTPRHGFVESRQVTSLKSLLDVFVQTRREDPEGEVIVMRRLTGKVSAVATEGGVTWAKGNDGATGAKGKQFHIPCPAGEWTKRIHWMSKALIDDIKGAAYAEIVEHNNEPVVVQLRDGPMIGNVSGNYIPHRDFLCVQTLAPASADFEDLLGWEVKMKAAPKGTVVIGVSGLSSHLAVQAICHSHAVWTEKVPTETLVGRTLQPSTEQPPQLRRRDYLYMRNFGKKRLHLDRQSAVPLAIATLHAMPFWGRDTHLLRLRMAGALTMLRLLTAACVGEARHFNRVGPGATQSLKSAIAWERLLEKGSTSEEQQRDTIYDKVLPRSLGSLVTLLEGCVADFSARGWERVPHCGDRHCRECGPECSPKKYSFGGPKWAAASKISLRLGKALVAFRDLPNKETWTEIVAAYNGGVLAAHNGGRALDKFLSNNWVDLCAKVPQFGMIGRMAMEVTTEMKHKVPAVPKAKMKLSSAQALAKYKASNSPIGTDFYLINEKDAAYIAFDKAILSHQMPMVKFPPKLTISDQTA